MSVGNDWYRPQDRYCLKRINKVKLYRPVAGDPDAYPQLTPALTLPLLSSALVRARVP